MGEKVLERKTSNPGDIIFKEGDEGNRAFVVQAGEVEIIKSLGDEDIVLGTISKGGIFGEMALIDDKPRMATARAAKEGATVIIVSRMMFQQKLANTDPFIRGLLNILSDHIRSINKGNEKKVDASPATPEMKEVDPREEP